MAKKKLPSDPLQFRFTLYGFEYFFVKANPGVAFCTPRASG